MLYINIYIFRAVLYKIAQCCENVIMQFRGVQYLYNMKTLRKKTLNPLSRLEKKYAFDPLTNTCLLHNKQVEESIFIIAESNTNFRKIPNLLDTLTKA